MSTLPDLTSLMLLHLNLWQLAGVLFRATYSLINIGECSIMCPAFLTYSVLSSMISAEIMLRTTSDVNVTCMEHVVLQCNITSPEPVEVISMAWTKDCNHTTSNPQCNYTENKSLTYTIPHATPAVAGEYKCTVEAKEGNGIALSTVTVGGEFSLYLLMHATLLHLQLLLPSSRPGVHQLY